MRSKVGYKGEIRFVNKPFRTSDRWIHVKFNGQVKQIRAADFRNGILVDMRQKRGSRKRSLAYDKRNAYAKGVISRLAMSAVLTAEQWSLALCETRIEVVICVFNILCTVLRVWIGCMGDNVRDVIWNIVYKFAFQTSESIMLVLQHMCIGTGAEPSELQGAFLVEAQ